jgi:hypothetical protein
MRCLSFPSISGDQTVGGTINLTPVGWVDEDPVSVNYQWCSDGVVIEGQTTRHTPSPKTILAHC